ncbi:WD40 repeat domain-containing protein [Aromatoleum toluolicum]|uniref:PQQ-binding-like beta-propeller repeat protein n=1 Tax=Aromatoleum toluolicum TaxID=90060 RepID=A0ABX1NNB4_9RHOO|nr:WD40 repeat domain-containing protein [Aromatoleum toluolicum]NMG00797.1 WD40 repeat domain-containing protein [Aromatoleum toluolicum]
MSVAILEMPRAVCSAIRSTPATDSARARSGLDAHNPWPGLAAYDEASQAYFHGREDAAESLLRLIRVAPVTALYGKSGQGKSSLLQAGVFPLLRAEHYLPVYVRLDFSEHAPCPPLEQAARRLEEEIARIGAECPPRAPGEGLWQFLHRRDLEIWSADNYPLIPVLVLDQFEELFSRSGSDRERIRAVFDELADLIENRIPTELATALGERERRAVLDINAQPYRIVLSFREDFLPELESWKDKVPTLLRNRLRLLPMTRAEAIGATERAGTAVLGEGVAAKIVDFVAPTDLEANGGAADVEPVLLSLCCTRLNRRRVHDGRIDATLVTSAGGDILRGFFAEALEGMPERVADFIETHLIQGEHYRGSYPREAALAEGHLTEQELATLTDHHHLLRIDQQQGVARIELIHDRLVGVVRQTRDERLARAREHRARNVSRRRLQRVAGALLAGLLGLAGWFAWTANRLSSDADHWFREAVDLSRTADQQTLRATALRLAADAQNMFAGALPEGGDRALLQALAADSLANDNTAVGASLLAGWARHRERKLMVMEDTVVALAFTGDGRGIISSGADHVLRIRDVQSGQTMGPVLAGHAEWVWMVAVSADGRRIVSGSEDTTLRLWDAESGRELLRARHPTGVNNVAISPDGRLLASASWDRDVRVWNAANGKLLALLHGAKAPVSALAFDRTGRHLVTGSADGRLRLWDARTGRDAGRRFAARGGAQAHGGNVASVTFSPDGRRIVSGGADGRVRIWDVTEGLPLCELKGHSGAVMGVAISPDGRLVVSGGWDGSLRAWDAHTCRAQGSAIAAHPGGVMKVAFSPDGKLLASGGADKTLRMWDAKVVQGLATPLAQSGSRPATLVMSADGRLVAAAVGRTRISLWDARSGEHVAALVADGATPLVALALSADGRRITGGGKDGVVRLWDRDSGRVLGQISTGTTSPIASLALSPDGRLLATGSRDKTARLWDTATGEHIRSFAGHRNPILSLAFSPDGRRIAAGSQDGSLRVWDAESGKTLVGPLEGHTGGVTSIAFSADGLTLGSGSWDNSLRLWDAASGDPLGPPLRGHADSLVGVGFDADGRQIVSVDKDGNLRLWPAPASWRQEICAKLNHNMSERQWQTWVSSSIPYQCQCPGLPIESEGSDANSAPPRCPAEGAASFRNGIGDTR